VGDEAPKRTQKRDEKAKEVTLANGQKAGQKPGQEADAKDTPATRVRDHDSHVLVCVGGDCKKRGSKGVCKALRGELLASDILGDVRIDTVDCLGLCKHGPNAVVYEGAEPKGTWCLGLQETEIPEVVEQHLEGGAPIKRLAADRGPRKAKKAKK
jgi:(2Fe-2S) ferredoxin